MKKRLIISMTSLILLLGTFLAIKLFTSHTQVQKTREEARQSQVKKEVIKKVNTGDIKIENHKDKKDAINPRKVESSLIKSSESSSQATSTTESKPNNSDTPISIPLPSSSIGNWVYKDETDGVDITITISPDGAITKVIKDNNPDILVQTSTAHINQVYDRNNGNYQIIAENAIDSAILIVNGFGGARIKYCFGMRLDNNTLHPIMWAAKEGEEIDFSKPVYCSALTRQ
ncbi:hypothetical protein MX111_04065 [Streptococcus uberis]|uniref:hypothetical protein n=1 Tax=Streptococcus uberis TaxID=1349 RepID=UPI0027DC241B|nr:hypothetical protein [Streptococcus uberis]MCK1238622.1 hypothetical protein [Streptococcus uberis]